MKKTVYRILVTHCFADKDTGENVHEGSIFKTNDYDRAMDIIRRKLGKFPENTLMEDVTQHIAQLDNVETVAAISKPIIVWNRNNSNSCSRDENLQGGKWKSSLYRYYADLLELEVKNPECQAELEHRRAVALDNIKNDRFVQ